MKIRKGTLDICGHDNHLYGRNMAGKWEHLAVLDPDAFMFYYVPLGGDEDDGEWVEEFPEDINEWVESDPDIQEAYGFELSEGIGNPVEYAEMTVEFEAYQITIVRKHNTKRHVIDPTSKSALRLYNLANRPSRKEYLDKNHQPKFVYYRLVNWHDEIDEEPQ